MKLLLINKKRCARLARRLRARERGVLAAMFRHLSAEAEVDRLRHQLETVQSYLWARARRAEGLRQMSFDRLHTVLHVTDAVTAEARRANFELRRAEHRVAVIT